MGNGILIHGLDRGSPIAPVPIRVGSDGSFTPWDRPVATLKTTTGAESLTYTDLYAPQAAMKASNAARGYITGDGWVNKETSGSKNVTSSLTFDMRKFVVTGFFVSEVGTIVDKIRVIFEDGVIQNFAARSHTGVIPIIGIAQLTTFQPDEVTLMGYLR